MKKITLTLASMLSMAAFGQTQRTVLLEEFTQASCGPCAQANPAFNKLIDANPTKVVSIKYQTSWPGTDPMNAQNKSEVATRVTYYNVQGVPDVSMDGKKTVYPSSVTQSTINKDYATDSPFKMELTQQINVKKDSIIIECKVTAAQAFTTKGPLYLRLALVEKTITFSKAPGSNGEKEFYSVMRKMLPSVTGSSLPVSWTNGQMEKVSIRAVIPSYIYDKNQLSVVGFLQTDNDKVVQQAIQSTSIITGIDESTASAAGLAIVYPNPMTDAATVGVQLFESNRVTLQVVNTLGQTVISNDLGKLDIGEQSFELNTAHLTPGLYFLNISMGNEVITKKISINR
ncbi:MAG TPA: T9SS type A sorting domain-containing protein [Bacteroidia bacterium]|nr:T9SS type A sorting domain-containing protein [Bacteroidia bacterium]